MDPPRCCYKRESSGRQFRKGMVSGLKFCTGRGILGFCDQKFKSTDIINSFKVLVDVQMLERISLLMEMTSAVILFKTLHLSVEESVFKILLVLLGPGTLLHLILDSLLHLLVALNPPWKDGL